MTLATPPMVARVLAVGNQGMGFQEMFCPLLWVARWRWWMEERVHHVVRQLQLPLHPCKMCTRCLILPQGGIETPESSFDSTVC